MSGREGLEVTLVDALAPAVFSSRGPHRGRHPSAGALEAAATVLPARPRPTHPSPLSPLVLGFGDSSSRVNRKNPGQRWGSAAEKKLEGKSLGEEIPENAGKCPWRFVS
jgi:hypothetical protein